MVVLLKKVKVVWYNDSGQEVQILEENREGYVLYEVFVYIIDNLIGDVIVFDYKKKVVVVVDRDGVIGFFIGVLFWDFFNCYGCVGL